MFKIHDKMEAILLKGDITNLKVDAIVNAANGFLEGGGGVDGAIHRAAGPELRQACIEKKRELGITFLPPGKVIITSGFNLTADYIIHTVGPIYNRRDSRLANQLKDCYINSLNIGDAYKCRTIAFPNISSGVYRYPKKEAAVIAIDAVRSYASTSITRVLFVCFDDENYQIYNQLLEEE